MINKRLILAITILTFFMSGLSCSDDRDIPTLKIHGQISGRDQTFYSVLVPADTTEEQLVNIIYEIRKAREGNYLNTYFPPTTPNGKMGKYAVIGIFIFSDPDMAYSSSLKKYMEGSNNNPSDVEFAQQYAEKVLAYYYYSIVLDVEFGCLGLRDTNVKPTTTFKKLFGKNYYDY